jgi:hypothetical protein
MTEEDRKKRQRIADKKSYEKHKESRREKTKKWRQANPEKVAAQKKRSYERNKEKLREKNKKLYEDNKDRYNANKKQYVQENKELYQQRWRDYYLRNKDEKLAYAKQYREANSEKVAYNNSRRRAKTRIKDELTEFVFQEAKKLCKEREKITGFKWHVDHIVPLQHKDACGLHIAANFQVVPAEWNHSKRNKNFDEYFG